MSLTATVIIAAYSLDRLTLTTKCVQSVLNGDQQPDELFVVVDNNEDLRAALQSAIHRSDVQIIPSPGSGAAAARNAAVELTSADLCLFIDDDAWAERGWLRSLVSAFSSDQIVGAGGKVLPDWGEGAKTLPPELLWIIGATYRGHPEGEVPITRPLGGNMAARTDCLRELGGFPARFGPKGGKKVSSNEELALYAAITGRYGRESVVYVPSSVVHHYVPAGRTTWRYLFERCWVEGTSKADVRAAFRPSVMAHDRQYAQSTLVPAIGRYAVCGVRNGDLRQLRGAAQCAVALGVTACGYLSRSLRLA